MTLLVGTDFSRKSHQAARTAAALAVRLGQPMVLMHVVDGPFAERSLERSGKRARRGLARVEAEAEALARPGLQIGVELRAGQPERLLAATAEELDASLVVVSANSGASAQSWLLGSVAERTLQTCRRPVLALRDCRPLRQWAEGTGRLRMVLGTDLAPGDSPGRNLARGLLRHGACSLTVAHVVWPPEEHRRFGIQDAAESLHPEAGLLVLGRLREWFGGAEPGVAFRVVSASGRVAEALLGAATEDRAHLVVVEPRRLTRLERLWEGSVSGHALRAASMSVLCVPAGDDTAPAFEHLERVLVATDLTPEGNRAVGYAVSLLAGGGDLHLMHVLGQLAEPEARSRLQALLPADLAPGTRVHLETPFAIDPALAICQAAERLGVDGVCLAIRRRSGLSRALGDSVSRRVAEECPVPVLLVPPPAARGPAYLGVRRQADR